MHFHGVSCEASIPGFVGLDGIVGEEIEDRLRVLLRDNKFEREDAGPVVVRVERGAEGFERVVVFHEVVGNGSLPACQREKWRQFLGTARPGVVPLSLWSPASL